jgi:hypothetical protein
MAIDSVSHAHYIDLTTTHVIGEIEFLNRSMCWRRAGFEPTGYSQIDDEQRDIKLGPSP